ncbi:hypothetical protein VPHK479_0068 [Vibrio phage K479]
MTRVWWFESTRTSLIYGADCFLNYLFNFESSLTYVVIRLCLSAPPI